MSWQIPSTVCLQRPTGIALSPFSFFAVKHFRRIIAESTNTATSAIQFQKFVNGKFVMACYGSATDDSLFELTVLAENQTHDISEAKFAFNMMKNLSRTMTTIF